MTIVLPENAQKRSAILEIVSEEFKREFGEVTEEDLREFGEDVEQIEPIENYDKDMIFLWWD